MKRIKYLLMVLRTTRPFALQPPWMVETLETQERFSVSLSKGAALENTVVRHAHRERKQSLMSAGLMLMTFVLTGCVGDLLQSKVVEPQVYVLHNTNAGTAKIAYPQQLTIALPQTAPGLDSTRIAVLRNGNELDYYFGARWGGTAPQVVQSFVVEALQAQQGFKGVASDGTRVDADYLLALELRDFQAEYANEKANPVVHVTFIGTLINIKSRKAVATLTASSKSNAKDNRLSAVVSAFQAATQEASMSLSEQLTNSLAKLN